MPLEDLLASGRFEAARLEFGTQEHDQHDCAARDWHRHHHADHTQIIGAWCYEADRLASREALREAAARLRADRIG